MSTINSHSRIAVLAALTIMLAASCLHGAVVPLRGDLPVGAGAEAVPISGGVPFSKGTLASAEDVRLLAADGGELDCQVTPTAWWPDGSIKWVMVDAVLTPAAALGSVLGWVAMGLPVVMAGDHERAGKYVSRLLFTAARRRWRECRTLARGA